MRRLVAPALALAALALPARDARAYFCTLAECQAGSAGCTNPRPTQVWQQRCIPFYISTSGSLLDSGSMEQLIIQSFNVWSSLDCTDMTFRYMGRTTETDAWDPNNPADNKNVIASIEDDYPEFEQTPGLLALTLTRYAVATGEIFDADILINAVDHEFDDVSDQVVCQAQTRAFDLRNTLVHEMGHFIGFDHSPIMDATMFASADACEVGKRDLANDDMMGMCTVYPKGEEAHTCTPPATYTPSGLDPSGFRDQCNRPITEVSSGGCSCGTGAFGAPADTAALIVMLAGAWQLARRRASTSAAA